MTSVPWLKDLAVPVADPPIAPVHPDDTRPAVKDLIEEHRALIDKIRDLLTNEKKNPLFVYPDKHDDLWILRFCLSHKGKLKPTLKAIEHTLLFREEHELDKKDIRKVPSQLMTEGKIKEYMDARFAEETACILTLPDTQRGVVCFLKFSAMVPGCSKIIPSDVWEWGFIHFSEWTYQWLDYVTRKTGRLTKQVRILDASGLSFSLFNRSDINADGKVMEKMEDCYPQLLESIRVCNAPSLIHALTKIVRPFMPKRVFEKFDIINPKKNEKERKRLYRHISEENLPVEYGGKNPLPPFQWKAPTIE